MVATADGRLLVLGGRTFVNSEAIVRPLTHPLSTRRVAVLATANELATGPAGPADTQVVARSSCRAAPKPLTSDTIALAQNLRNASLAGVQSHLLMCTVGVCRGKSPRVGIMHIDDWTPS